MKAADGLNYRDRRGAPAHHTPLTDAIHAAARNEQSLQFRISDLRAVAGSNAPPTARPVSTVPQEQVDAIDQILTPPAANPMLFTGVQPTPPKNYFIPMAAGLGLVTVFMGVIVALALYVLDSAAAPAPQRSAVNVMEATAATTTAATTTVAIAKPTPSREAASVEAAPRVPAPEAAPQRKSAAIDDRSDRRPRRLTKRQLRARRRARARRARRNRARRARARRARRNRVRRARRNRARRARRNRARRAALASHQPLRQDEIDALLR